MKGLIVDTSRDPAILGLIQDDRVEQITLIDGAKNLSETLFPTLEKFCQIKDLDYIAVGVGPGSYMGIRTGATIAKTLAFAASLPLIEFPSPLAFLPQGKEGSFVFIGDAKMGQLYLLRGNTGDRQLTAPLLLKSEELNIGQADFVVGPGFLTPKPNLEWAAREVYDRFIQKKYSDIASLELTYLR